MLEKSKSGVRKQVNILLDEEDIKRLDILAREAGCLTRSSLLRLLLRQALEQPNLPNSTTLQRTCIKVRMLDFEKTKNQLLEEQGGEDEDVAAASTGFSPGPASRYDLTRTGRRSQRWAKGVAAVGTQSPFIPAWRSGWRPGSDVTELPGLRRDARRYGRCRGRRTAWGMMAAAGVDGPTVRADDLVPPVRPGGHLLYPERSAQAHLTAPARRDGLLRQYWKSDTVHAVIQRMFGDTLRSRRRSLQRREPIIKGLVYNIHR